MLTKVDVITKRGTTLSLPLFDAEDGYLIKDIDGLDPVSATIVSSSFAQLDGTQYQSSRRDARNITMKLGLGPSYSSTPRELRNNLYSYLMPKSDVTLRFFIEDEEPVDIQGRVEDFESPRFTQEPEADISIKCFNPDFYIPTPKLYVDTIDWDNPSALIDYEGTVETGFKFKLNVNRDLNNFTITNTSEDGIPHILQYSGPTLTAGDVLYISTVSGDKYVRKVRAGVTTSLLYAVTTSSEWVNLYPGVNDVKVQMVYVSGYAAMQYTLEYITKFGAL